MSSIKSLLVRVLKKSPGLRILARNAVKNAVKNQYESLTKKLELCDKKVVFEVFAGKQYGCNPKAIYKEMLKEPAFDNWDIVWVFVDPQDYKNIDELQSARLVKYKTKEYYIEVGTAKYIFTNSMLLEGIYRKENQIIFQTWHGTPLKRLRCDINIEGGNANNTLDEIKARNDRDTIRYTHFLSPSAWASDRFISSFNLVELGMENIITEVGYPRNDLLINYTQEDVDRIHETLDIPKGKKIILYAPTFRDNKHKSGSGYQYDMCLDFDRLQRELGNEYIILFRTHYFIANVFDFTKYEGFIYNMAQLDDITNLYLIADILITDYSSVFFDYANLKRPIIYYMYDLDEYANEIRGFYLDVNELPGDIAKTEEELITSIRKIDNGGFQYDDKYKAFNEKYNYLDDGNAARRVIEKVFG